MKIKNLEYWTEYMVGDGIVQIKMILLCTFFRWKKKDCYVQKYFPICRKKPSKCESQEEENYSDDGK